MYGPLRLCKAFVSDDLDSLRKCIRPLASELRLQPGHDEICALRSQILSAGTRPGFPEGLTKRRSTVSSSLLEPRKLDRALSMRLQDPAVHRGTPADS